MKKIIIILPLLVSINKALAQNATIDSLKLALSISMADTARVLTMENISFYYQASNPDSAFHYAQTGYDLAQKINFKKGEAYCINAFGYVFFVTGNYSKAAENYLKALKIREELGEPHAIAVSTGNIGSVFNIQGNYPEAIRWQNRTLQIDKSLHDTLQIIIDQINIGEIYQTINRRDSALSCFNEAYKLSRLHNDVYIGDIFHFFGKTHNQSGNLSLALEYYRKSIPYLRAENDQLHLSHVFVNMAEVFQKNKEVDSSIFYSGKAFELARNSSNNETVLSAGRLISSIYDSLHITDSAYYYFRIAMSAKDNIANVEKVGATNKLLFTEQLRQQELIEAKRKEKEERKINIQIMGIAAFIPLFFGLVLLLSRRKAKPRTIEFMGLIGLLLLFEFIALFIHPYIELWTHHTPVYMILILVGIASLLVPFHHKLEHWIKEKLKHKQLVT